MSPRRVVRRHLACFSLLLSCNRTPQKEESIAAVAPPDIADAGDVEPSEPEAKTQTPPIVDLDGKVGLDEPIDSSRPRLYSTSLLTEVHSKPDPDSPVVGALRAGSSAYVSTKTFGTKKCPGGFRKIEPYGFVCVGPEATLDKEHAIVRASHRPPDVTQKLPYMYGIAKRGGPAYARIPTQEDLKTYEPNLGTHLAKWAKDTESGATYGLDVWLKWSKKTAPAALSALEQRITDDDIPWFLRDGRRVPNLSGLVKSKDVIKLEEFDRRNGVAFIDSFLYEGRRYNVSTDLRVMPADRFRPIRGSDFHGVRIGKDIEFPFALVRASNAPKWILPDGKGRFVKDGEVPWRSAIQLTGNQKFAGGKFYYEAKEGFWVDDRSAGRVDPAKKMPAWGKSGEKWIDVNITKQVLVAYEGQEAVYATLVSTGEAGLGDPEKTKSTKRGIFRVHTKFVTATMDSDLVGEEFELRDVPYVQYFENGYALHGAYWHDGFGKPKSHGCINLSPEDARRLFFWTEPAVPRGFHGAAKALTGTIVFIHP